MSSEEDHILDLNEELFKEKLNAAYTASLTEIMPIIKLPRYIQIKRLTIEERHFFQKLVRNSANLLLIINLYDPNQVQVRLDVDQAESFELNQYTDWQIESIEFNYMDAVPWIGLYFQDDIKPLAKAIPPSEIKPLRVIIALLGTVLSLLLFYLMNFRGFIAHTALFVGGTCLFYLWEHYKSARQVMSADEIASNEIWICEYFAAGLTKLATQKLFLDALDREQSE